MKKFDPVWIVVLTPVWMLVFNFFMYITIKKLKIINKIRKRYNKLVRFCISSVLTILFFHILLFQLLVNTSLYWSFFSMIDEGTGIILGTFMYGFGTHFQVLYGLISSSVVLFWICIIGVRETIKKKKDK